jgi:serine/threonine-protein phosphatase CPPED1
MSDETTASNSALYRDGGFRTVQRNRTVVHPRLDPSRHHPASLPQEQSTTTTSDDHDHDHGDEQYMHTFVVCADTQLGMTNMNRDWGVEMEYSGRAVEFINRLVPRPLFCCVCGDLVDMTSLIYKGKPLVVARSSSSSTTTTLSEEDCDRIQDEQFRDFKQVWSRVHPDIALVCLCGNHDVGNRPTPASIERFVSYFGDDYLSWWANGSFNIVVNTSLFADPTAAQALFDEQLQWLEDRLKHAQQNRASHIFVFGHHPWFLYRDDEASEELPGKSPFPPDYVPDGYFHIPIERRRLALALFERYGVSAAFCGHFHQNLIAKASFGMDMIVTGPLSLVFQSSGVPNDFPEPKTRGLRVVRVRRGTGRFVHEFVSI